MTPRWSKLRERFTLSHGKRYYSCATKPDPLQRPVQLRCPGSPPLIHMAVTVTRPSLPLCSQGASHRPPQGTANGPSPGCRCPGRPVRWPAGRRHSSHVPTASVTVPPAVSTHLSPDGVSQAAAVRLQTSGRPPGVAVFPQQRHQLTRHSDPSSGWVVNY